MKKLLISLIGLVTSFAVVAANYAEEVLEFDCAAGQPVYVPSEDIPCTQPYHVALQYLYVQPGGGGPTFSNDARLDWGSGIRLDVGYHYGQDNDVTANFTFFDFTSKEQIPVGVPDPGDPAREQRIRDYYYNLNVEFGHKRYYSEKTSMRVHVGAHYAQIRRDFEQGFGAGNGLMRKFEGYGPRFGLDTNYSLLPWLELTGSFAVAALLGDAAFKDHGDTFSRTRTVIPAADGRLGGQIVIPSTWVNGDLIVDAGYLWSGYFGAMPTEGLGQDNYSYHGLYAGLRWRGDFA